MTFIKRFSLSRRQFARHLFFVMSALPFLSLAAAESELWGRSGEKWIPDGRLPDFSWAGYHCGEDPIPELPPGVSVKEFGAKGDGKTDDTAAFLEALSRAQGAVEVPAGRYVITKILDIDRPDVVLRGEGSDRSVLVCPVPLNEIKPNWGATTAGRPTSNYSWSGGMVRIKGDPGRKTLASITKPAKRGETALTVSSTERIRPGQRIAVAQRDDAENTLASHLYSGDPGGTGKLKGSTKCALVCRVTAVEGDTIQIDRPLRFDVRAEWKPAIESFAPTVSESGIEGLCFEFPETDYEGHFTELGHNAIALEGVADCWVRNIRILNADSGIFVGGTFCTVEDIVLESARKPDARGNTGHHGVSLGREDNFFARFDYRTRFIHDISVSRCAGNVIADGKGEDLSFDHHKRTPYENLFTNIDAGKGTRLWASGGGADLGKHCAARGTFWNIRADRPLSYPKENFAPLSINVLVRSDEPAQTDPKGKWFESFWESELEPANLHRAQLERRLSEAD